jgi:hypothetical protein
MRTVREVLEELTSHVMPPRGIAIEIKEMPSKGSKEPNWVARVSAMNSDRTQLFSEKVLALRKSDRLIDWEELLFGWNAASIARAERSKPKRSRLRLLRRRTPNPAP